MFAFYRNGHGETPPLIAVCNFTPVPRESYCIGAPHAGLWHEVFNSDVYDQWVNPNAQGNPGGITAAGPAWDGLPASAAITLPANSVLMFAYDRGDF